MAVPAGAIALVTFKGSYANQRILLTLPYRCATAPAPEKGTTEVSAALAAAAVAAGAGKIRTNYLAMLPTTYTLQEVRAQLIWPTRFRYAVELPNATGSIIATGPGNIAATMTNWSVKAGRDQISTKHIGPLPPSLQSSGSLTNDGIASMLALQASILADINLTPAANGLWRPTIYHKNLKVGGLISDDLVSGIVFDQVRVMRRRTVGLGE